MSAPGFKFLVDSSLVDQICDEFRHEMLQETFNCDNPSYLTINHRFLEQLRHTFYSTWCLDQRKHAIYLHLEREVDKEAADQIVSFIAQLADLMNSVVMVRCDSDLDLLVYKCLQSLILSNHSLYDLVRISVWRDDKHHGKRKFFKHRKNVLPVLKNIGKNQYHAMLSSESDVWKLVAHICEIVNDFGCESNRLVWISRREVPPSLEAWLISSSLYFETPGYAADEQLKLKLVSSKSDEGRTKLEEINFDKNSGKVSVNRALINILQDKPLSEFVRSQNVRIVQYLVQVRIPTSNLVASSWRSGDTEQESLSPSVPPSPLDGVNPEATLNFDVIHPIITKLEKENSGRAEEKKNKFQHEQEFSRSGERMSSSIKYAVQSSDGFERSISDYNYSRRYSYLIDTMYASTVTLDSGIISELSDAFTEALHCGNVQIVAILFKSICTYGEKVDSNLVQFFDTRFLVKQYEESFRRDENYFRKLMADLGLKPKSNIQADLSAKFVDKVMDKLMYRNKLRSQIHQSMNKDPKKSRSFFQLYIFIWGILTQNLEIAELALKWYPCSTEQTITALAATRILDGIIEFLKNDHQISTESIKELNSKKVYFENLSLQLLKEDECSIQEEEENVESARMMREVSKTLPISMMTSIKMQNRVSEKKPTYTYTKTFNKKLEAMSGFWGTSTLMMAHQGECKLFIASEEVQGFVHKKNEKYNVKRKQVVDLIFILSFYIFHCFLSLKLVPERENESETALITYTVLLGIYGTLVIILLCDTIIRNLRQIKLEVQNNNKAKFINLVKSSGTNTYIRWLFFLNFVIGYPLRIVEVTKPEGFSVTISGIFFSINALILFIEVLKKSLKLNRKLSITINLFISSIKKNLHFVILTFMFMFGFGMAQYILKCGQTSCLVHQERGIWDYIPWILLEPFNVMFGTNDVERDTIEEATSLRTIGNESSARTYSGEWMFTSTAFMLLGLLAIWQFISHIIIINLLIANFIKIYEEISNEADLLWKKELLNTYLYYRDWCFIPFFYLLHRPEDAIGEDGSVDISEVGDEQETQPRSGRYWRHREEEERRLQEIQRQEERNENIVLTLMSSNYQTRKHLGRIENYLKNIHQEPLHDRGDDEDDIEGLMLGSFII